jgi:flagellar biosynthesis/type III secretory pathway M-ring protein FliF/YscJ
LPAWLRKLAGQKHFSIIAGIGGAAFLTLAAGLVVALSRRGKKKTITAEPTAVLEAGRPKALGPTPQEIERQIQEHLAEQSSEKARQEAEALMKLRSPAVSTKKTEVLTKHIAAEAKKDPTAMAQVVRTWLRGEGQR